MILTSLLLLAALVYTGVYLYRYLIGLREIFSIFRNRWLSTSLSP